jgi:hypothetical protein
MLSSWLINEVINSFRGYLPAYFRVINFYADGLVGIGHASSDFQFFYFLLELLLIMSLWFMCIYLTFDYKPAIYYKKVCR